MYIYQLTDLGTWTVGYFDPNSGAFIGESDHDAPELAAQRIHYLYGGRVEARYVYLQTEVDLWTVGFFDPTGEFHGESDHTDPEDAAMRIHYLNGGTQGEYIPNSIEPATAKSDIRASASIYSALAILATYAQVDESQRKSVVDEAIRTLAGTTPANSLARRHSGTETIGDDDGDSIDE